MLRDKWKPRLYYFRVHKSTACVHITITYIHIHYIGACTSIHEFRRWGHPYTRIHDTSPENTTGPINRAFRRPGIGPGGPPGQRPESRYIQLHYILHWQSLPLPPLHILGPYIRCHTCGWVGGKAREIQFTSGPRPRNKKIPLAITAGIMYHVIQAEGFQS